MSFTFALMFLLSGQVLSNTHCGVKLLWQDPITCEGSFPCLFMRPVVEEVFPDSFTSEVIFENSGSCDCTEGACQQASVFIMGQTLLNVPCWPEICVTTVNPITTCETDSHCGYSYPSPTLEFANDWAAKDLTCNCVKAVCQANVTVGFIENLNKTAVVDCRGIQLETSNLPMGTI